jgi:hypothetical protein
LSGVAIMFVVAAVLLRRSCPAVYSDFYFRRIYPSVRNAFLQITIPRFNRFEHERRGRQGGHRPVEMHGGELPSELRRQKTFAGARQGEAHHD